MPPDGTPHFEETAAGSPVPNTWVQEIEGKVSEDGTLDATVRITARGDSELAPRQVFIGPAESVWPFTVQGIVKGIDRRVDKVSDVKISDPTTTNEPFTLSFRISKPRFLDLSMGVIQFKLPMVDVPLPSVEGEGVTNGSRWYRIESEPLHLGPPSEHTYKIKLELPQGFKLITPSDFESERPYGTYQASYKLERNFVMAECTLVIRKDELPSTLVEDYSAFRRKILADSGQSLEAQVVGKTE